MKAKIFYEKVAKEILDIILSVKLIHQFQELNLNQLKLFAKEFHAFVDYFPKYLGALIWQSPYESIRLVIIDNLIDESGGLKKIENLDTSATHPMDFRRFAYKLGLDDQVLFDLKSARPYTIKMLEDLNDLSIKSEFFVSLGGIAPGVENVFHAWIKIICDGLKQHDIFDSRDLYYFSSHAILDIEHGEQFKNAILPILADKEKQDAIQQGAHRMTQIICNFFYGLSEDLKLLQAETDSKLSSAVSI